MALSTMNSRRRDGILPRELIPIILDNMDKKELLECRLVCNYWDEECRKILKKTFKWRVSVQCHDISEDIAIFEESNPPRCILPLELIFAVSDEEKEFLSNLKYLLELLGENCILSYKVNHESFGTGHQGVEAGKQFLNLLDLISKGVEKLDMRFLELNLSESQVSAITAHRMISLPYLKEFIAHKETVEGDIKIPKFFNHILLNCPNLETLVMIGPNENHGDISDWKIPFTKLTTLEISRLKPTFPFLKKIEWSKPPIQTLKVTQSLITTHEDGVLLRKILICLSNTLCCLTLDQIGQNVCITFPHLAKLKSIVYYKEPYCGPAFNSVTDINFNGAEFPSLEKLEIGINSKEDLKGESFPTEKISKFPMIKSIMIQCISNQLTWAKKTFPYSEELNVPLNFLYSRRETTFQNVTEIKIRCESVNGRDVDFPNKSEDEVLSENMKNFHKIFPSMNKITIILPRIDLEYREEDPRNDYYSVRLVKLVLLTADANNLREICILNVTANFLGKAIKELLFPPRITLDNIRPDLIDAVSKTWEDKIMGLESIEMSLEAQTGSSSHGQTVLLKSTGWNDLSPKVLNGVEIIKMVPSQGLSVRDQANMEFELIAKQFPNLKELTIPGKWLSQDGNIIVERVERISKLFPAVEINQVWIDHLSAEKTVTHL